MYLYIFSYAFIYILILSYCNSLYFHLVLFIYRIHFMSLILYFLYLYTGHVLFSFIYCTCSYTFHVLCTFHKLSYTILLGFMSANTLEADTGNNCMYPKILSLYETVISICIYPKVSSLYETVTSICMTQTGPL